MSICLLVALMYVIVKKFNNVTNFIDTSTYFSINLYQVNSLLTSDKYSIHEGKLFILLLLLLILLLSYNKKELKYKFPSKTIDY